MKFVLTISIVFLLLVSQYAVAAESPRLILQITVDQLRGDLTSRYGQQFEDGGFRYLFENGTVYANAYHAHANTETVVGHVTLATGAYPSTHGVIANLWFDREEGVTQYNIEDSHYKLLTPGGDVDKKTEIDPSQKKARSDGRSAAAIMTTTFGDELVLNSAGKAKVFGISVKDRGAVSMAGHSGKAFWFSKGKGQFVTSTYYYDKYPQWVTDWNDKELSFAYADTSWELANEKEAYIFGEFDDQEWETDLAGFGRVFPHPYGAGDGKYFTTLLTISPAGDELTLDFAKTLIENEKIGQDEITDYLSISFSSTDYIGHLFGPTSLESEDNIVRLDKMLADLFEYVEEKIGLDNTLIILSADHGTPDAPGYLQAHNIEASYVQPENWDKAPAIDALKTQFGVGEELIQAFEAPYIYLNREVIKEMKLDEGEVERAVAAELVKFFGVAAAFASSDLAEGKIPDTGVARAVLKNYYPKRSGNIYIVFEPHHFINDFDGLEVSCTHGSPWRYDSYVPLVFAGAGVKSQIVYRKVETVDLAPTLSALLGINYPSGTDGTLLVEVLGE